MDLQAVIEEVWGNYSEAQGLSFEISRVSTGYNLELRSEGFEPTHHILAHTAIAHAMETGRIAIVLDQWLDESIQGHKLLAAPKQVDIPLFSEAVVGYRKWRLDDWVLSPLNYGKPWRPGVNKAVCQPGRPRSWGLSYLDEIDGVSHKAPHHGCHCGMNAFFEPKGIREGGDVLGALVGWGDLQVHPDGFRAEYAQIVALVADAFDLAAVANLYQVPLVKNIEALQVEASKHGSPLPESLRPPDTGEVPGLLSSATVTYAQATSVVKSGGYSTSPLASPLGSPPTKKRMAEMLSKIKAINEANAEYKTQQATRKRGKNP